MSRELKKKIKKNPPKETSLGKAPIEPERDQTIHHTIMNPSITSLAPFLEERGQYHANESKLISKIHKQL